MKFPVNVDISAYVGTRPMYTLAVHVWILPLCVCVHVWTLVHVYVHVHVYVCMCGHFLYV